MDNQQKYLHPFHWALEDAYWDYYLGRRKEADEALYRIVRQVVKE